MHFETSEDMEVDRKQFSWKLNCAVYAFYVVAIMALIVDGIARRQPMALLAVAPFCIALLPLAGFWRDRALRYHVWLRDEGDLEAAREFCVPMRWRCNVLKINRKYAFTFSRKRDAVAFKLGWG